MPRNAGAIEKIENLSMEDRLKEPTHSMEHWYILTGYYCRGLTALDVGAGTGSGLSVLQSMGALETLGIDPLPAGSTVLPIDVSMLRDASFDIVTSFDVIEHVEDDIVFLNSLLRVCRCAVFLSTPNWNTWHCANKFHVREYTPEELAQLLAGQQYMCWTAGANRALEPVRPCTLVDAQSSFCVAIRGPSCSDTQWLNMLEAAGSAAAVIPERLSRLGKWSGEWNEELKQMFLSKESPISGLAEVAHWIDGLVRLSSTSLVPADRKSPVMDVLRYGSGTRDEHFAVIAWIAEMISTHRNKT